MKLLFLGLFLFWISILLPVTLVFGEVWGIVVSLNAVLSALLSLSEE